jgi:hypothetical protein
VVVSGIVPTGHVVVAGGFTIIGVVGVVGVDVVAAIASWVITGLAANSNTAAEIAMILDTTLTFVFIVL